MRKSLGGKRREIPLDRRDDILALLRAFRDGETRVVKKDGKDEYRNSRMKDFHDVWALGGAFEFGGRALQRAIEACFERRGRTWTAEPPPALTPEFYADPTLRTRWAQ